MKILQKMFVLMICFMTIFTACGPSPEAVATMTASAWTPTPEPTLTPTPLPYDLEVSLANEGGEAISYGVYVEATENEKVMMDDSGVVELLNLPGPEVEVSVTAQGYAPLTENITIERGKNLLQLSLQTDPLQVNPETACPDGAKVLYIEDFEDGFAQDWDGISRPTFSFDTLEDGGTVLTYAENNPNPAGTPIMLGQEVGNFVWKFDTFNENDLFIHIHEKDEKKYLIRFQPGGEGFQLIKQDGPDHVGSAYRGFNVFEWVNVAIVFYENALEVWINDELYTAFDDPDPYTSGGLMMHFAPEQGAVSLDNMVICELSQPYSPIVETEPAE